MNNEKLESINKSVARLEDILFVLCKINQTKKEEAQITMNYLEEADDLMEYIKQNLPNYDEDSKKIPRVDSLKTND